MTPKRRVINLSWFFLCLCFSKSLLIKLLRTSNYCVPVLFQVRGRVKLESILLNANAGIKSFLADKVTLTCLVLHTDYYYPLDFVSGTVGT